MTKGPLLPYGRQCIEEDDIAAVVEVLRGDYLTTGPAVARFEQALCEVTGAEHAVVCANGTAALHLAMLALNLGPGDAVIVPSITFLATANAVRFTGAEVVFADVDPQSGLMGAEHLQDAIRRCCDWRLRAVVPVHLGGQCADLPALKFIADAAELEIVTDGCHALGSNNSQGQVGSCAHEAMTTFSFHPVKTIAMGEGGAITTNRAPLAEQMRLARSHGMQRRPEHGPWFYEMDELGYNYRATDMQCALGLTQLKKLDRFVTRRRELAAMYDELLQPLAPSLLTPQRVSNGTSAWHLYAVRIDFAAIGRPRTEIMEVLADHGIGTQVHYIPVHRQPYYAKRYGATSLPGAETYYQQTLSLPLFPAMTDADILRVVAVLSEVLGE